MKKKDYNSKEKMEEKDSPTEINPYAKRGFLARIPYSVKAIFLKWWFFACGYFFVGWGLTSFIGGDDTTAGGVSTIIAIVLALFNGVVTDMMVDNIISLMDSDKKESQWYIMFHNGKIYSLLINILYSFVITFLMVYTVEGIGLLFESTIGNAGPFKNGLEPILTGIICLFYDLIFIGIKDLIVYNYRKRKKGKEDTHV